MRRKRNGHLVIDLLGTVALAACIGGSAWFFLIRADEAAKDLKALNSKMSEAQGHLASIGRIMDEQQATLATRRAHLESTGQLPSRMPIEDYSQEVLQLASRHGIRVIRQGPVDSQLYSGLLEQRYAYEMSGLTGDLLSFLMAIEGTSFWADIAYLRLEEGANMQQGKRGHRKASFTVSLFSAPNDENSAVETG